MKKTQNPTHDVTATDVRNRQVDTKAFGTPELMFLLKRLINDGFTNFAIVKLKGVKRKQSGQLKLDLP